jgi:hypothetical protein
LQQQGFQAPVPPPAPYGSGAHTSPPYAISPNTARPGGGARVAVIVIAAVVALVVLGVLIAAIGDSGDDRVTPGSDPTRSSESYETSGPTDDPTQRPAAPGGGGESDFNPGDKTKVIKQEKCTDAYESFEDKSKVSAPQLQFYDLTSVKQCLNAAGWRYSVEYEDENVWGKDIVIRQTPLAGDAFDPNDKTEKFVLTVSTGKPA